MNHRVERADWDYRHRCRCGQVAHGHKQLGSMAIYAVLTCKACGRKSEPFSITRGNDEAFRRAEESFALRHGFIIRSTKLEGLLVL